MRILVLANNGLGLCRFRIELMQSLIDHGFEVYVSFPRDENVNTLLDLGCKYFETNIDRRGINPLTDIKLLMHYIKAIKDIKPSIVLTYTIKPNIYGGIACIVTKTPYIANITGLGTSIENKGLVRKIALALYRIGLRKAICVFFQNEPNRRFFIENRIALLKTRIIAGSGVNLTQHHFEEYPSNAPIRFLFIGRIMKAKGIGELLSAAEIVKIRFPDVQFDLVGDCEEDYGDELTRYVDRGVIKYYGKQSDVHSFIKRAHATILPSYHEGMANVLLESAASGRPVLASRVTGCIETFDEGVSGLGFEAKSVDSLVNAIIKFVELPYEQKKAMGLAARRKMEREFDRRSVVKAYMEEVSEIMIRLEEK